MAGRFLRNTMSLTAGRVIAVASQVLVLPVLSRFLTVEEFGVAALAMTLVIFAQLFSDAGLGRSLIRRDHVDPAEWSSVFWLLVVIGIGLALLCIAIAPVWAWFFAQPQVAGLVAAMSTVPMLLAWTAVPAARLERDDRFPVIAALRTVSALAGMGAAILLAVHGAGAWAIAGQQIVLAAVQCTGIWMFSAFRPLSPRHRVPLLDHFTFARDSLGVSLLQTAQRQVPMMLIGQVLGAGALGLHSMTQRFLNLPLNGLAGPAAQVVYVRMAAVKDQPGAPGRLYESSIRLLALATFPPMAILAGCGGDVFALVLSEDWRQVGTLFALAAPGIALETATSCAGVMFQATGRTGMRLRMVAERTALRILAISAALPFGITGVAAAITLFAMAFLPRYWHFAHRAAAFDRVAALRTMTVPALVSLAAFSAMQMLPPGTSGWTVLMLAGAALAICWPIAALLQRTALRAALAAFGN